MRVRIVLALAGVAAMAATVSVVALASVRTRAAGGATVTVRIEGVKKTLQQSTPTKTGTGWITKYGAPKGKCPANSAQGALDAVTGGHWKGTWYSSYNEYLVTEIDGEKPPSKNLFWEIYVNNVPASKGACEIKLRRNEQLLFADTTGKEGASVLKAPASASVGRAFTVTLVGHPPKAKGKVRPLSGIRITGQGIKPAKTNSHGVARITAEKSGKPVLQAAPNGYIRSEAVVYVSH